MTTKSDLQAKAESLGLSTSGTVADLQARIADAVSATPDDPDTEEPTDDGDDQSSDQSDSTPDTPQDPIVDHTPIQAPDPDAQPEQPTTDTITVDGVDVTKTETDSQYGPRTLSYVTEHYVATVNPGNDDQLVDVFPRGWIGPTPLRLPLGRVPELVALLGALSQ